VADLQSVVGDGDGHVEVVGVFVVGSGPKFGYCARGFKAGENGRNGGEEQVEGGEGSAEFHDGDMSSEVIL